MSTHSEQPPPSTSTPESNTQHPHISPNHGPDQPVAIICVGMAGSGKTTFTQRLNAHLHAKKTPPYVINLDPAVIDVPFESNIDIRDNVRYKDVMSQFNLGPNGAIVTSLNLFATKIDQVISLCEKRTRPSKTPEAQAQKEMQSQSQSQPDVKDNDSSSSSKSKDGEAAVSEAANKGLKYILVDTPGQIEVFLWSASGQIILESVASSFPTVLVYVVDTPRTTSCNTFMSNMLYACSIFFKTRLPMVLVFNKIDVQPADFAFEWMRDYDAFAQALETDNSLAGAAGDHGDGGSGYIGSLLNSMALVLEEFYGHLSAVAVSSMTGAGMDDLVAALHEKAEEFRRDYAPELQRKRIQRDEEKARKRDEEVDKMLHAMKLNPNTVLGRNLGGGDLDETLESASDVSEDDIDADVPGQSLQERYQQELRKHETLDQEASFAKYIRTNKGV